MDDGQMNTAQSGRQIAEIIWPYYSELLRMGAEQEEALNLTFLLMKSLLGISR